MMFDTLKTMLVDELSVNEADIKPDAELVNDLGINSLELADLVLLCEERFGIEISDDDVRSFLTVQDVTDYLDKKAEKN
ncbi:MAG: acyl carrier protein [Clostridia bacterium]|nr:acyl carrier protein [Clostridia bacterium]MBQ5356390.1 acyl carrier protein [Clostridia bacterium]